MASFHSFLWLRFMVYHASVYPSYWVRKPEIILSSAFLDPPSMPFIIKPYGFPFSFKSMGPPAKLIHSLFSSHPGCSGPANFISKIHLKSAVFPMFPTPPPLPSKGQLSQLSNGFSCSQSCLAEWPQNECHFFKEAFP